MLTQTFHMHAMTTAKEDHLIRAGCQVMRANRTIGVQTSLTTGMCMLIGDRHAYATTIAMVIIDTDAPTDATDPTAFAMVGGMTLSIIEKLTFETEVTSKLLATASAFVTHRLILFAATDAGYLLGGMTINLVRLVLVMAATTGVVLTAARGFYPALPHVMVAAISTALSWENARGCGPRATGPGLLFCV